MIEVSKVQVYYIGIPLTILSILIYLIFGLNQLPLSATLFVLGFGLINIGYWGNVLLQNKQGDEKNGK